MDAIDCPMEALDVLLLVLMPFGPALFLATFGGPTPSHNTALFLYSVSAWSAASSLFIFL